MNNPIDDLSRMIRDHFPAPKPPAARCKVCGDPTADPSRLCSPNCIVEWYGLTDDELRPDDDEEEPRE